MLLSMAAEAQSLRGDLNGDGKVDVTDIVTLVNIVLDKESSTESTGRETVDLGLPSGTKWANMNVGAEKPEDVGLYFAWGETTGYLGDDHNFAWETHVWCNGSNTSLTKYCGSSRNGIVDNKTLLDLDDDAAYVNWGSQWRMPTITEFQELINNTTSEWITQNGVNGRKFTSKTNGNSIFMPAAGYRSGTSAGSTPEPFGYYWSSLCEDEWSDSANYFSFFSGSSYTSNMSRFAGMNVRPVRRN